MEKVLYGPPHVDIVPPHVRYDFFRPASKESTACPNELRSHGPIFCLIYLEDAITFSGGSSAIRHKNALL